MLLGIRPVPSVGWKRDRRTLGSAVAIALLAASATASVVTGCSSDDATGGGAITDSGAETSSISDAEAGDVVDASPAPRDAAPFDGGPLPIVCASSPCAKQLVTTTRSSGDAELEGFCARLADGTVACWGADDRGQLGRGGDASVAGSPVPARVAGLTKITELEHTCALDEDGAIWCWGEGPYLQDDAASTTTTRTPVKLALPPATSMSVGRFVGCAVVERKLVCWGSNASAQLAPFESVPSSTTVGPREVAIPDGAPLRKVFVGAATFVLREDGSLPSWGEDPPLGRVSSLHPNPHPKPIALGGVSSLDLADGKACATAAGTGYCWGAAGNALPTPVQTPEPIVQIATTPYHLPRWCAVGASGAVYCWGTNTGGQAGDGTKEHAFEAVRVKGLPGPAAEVRTTINSTCALMTNGKIYCWGTNFYGQLGNGKLKVPSLVPQEVVLP